MSCWCRTAPIRCPVDDLEVDVLQSTHESLTVLFTEPADLFGTATQAVSILRVFYSPASPGSYPDFGPWMAGAAEATPVLSSGIQSPHAVSVESLIPGTLYHFVIVAEDGAGNQSPPSNIARGSTSSAPIPAPSSNSGEACGQGAVPAPWG